MKDLHLLTKNILILQLGWVEAGQMGLDMKKSKEIYQIDRDTIIR